MNASFDLALCLVRGRRELAPYTADDQPTPRFRHIPRLPNAVDVDPAPPPVLERGTWLPTHGFCTHTATLADNAGVGFGWL